MLLLHLGAGLMHLYFSDDVPDINFDNLKQLGLKGTYVTRFPTIAGLSASQGGMKNMGPNAQSHQILQKPTANASFTWVRNNHTYDVKLSNPGAARSINGVADVMHLAPPSLEELPYNRA